MVGSYIDFGIKTDIDTLDITNLSSVEEFFKKIKPEVVLHMAAETDVDRCEREPSYAYRVNAVGTHNISIAAREYNAKMVYVSTSGIFDGKKEGAYSEKDIPNPQTVYGRTKFLGEVMVKDIVPEFLIVRAGWMIGGGPEKDKKFVSKIVKQLNSPEIKAVSDTVGSPTFAKDLIGGIKKLLKEERTGLFHLSNQGVCSRYDMAREIIRILGSSAKVISVDASYFSSDASRVSSEAMTSKIDIMRPWKEALKDYLLTEWGDYRKLSR